MDTNYPAALAFVWGSGRDDPADGYHISPHDPGLGTFGGVTEALWAVAVKAKLVNGPLAKATTMQLSLVLHSYVWSPACGGLPQGIDLMVFNGSMMSREYPRLFQRALGSIGADVDGWIGPETMRVAQTRDAETLIPALTGIHHGYLADLSIFPNFGGGWTKRLVAVRDAALAMVRVALPLPSTIGSRSPW